MEQEKKQIGRPKVEKLPKGWALYNKIQLQQTGYAKGEKQVKQVGEPIKVVQLSEDQADELNVHKFNTLIEYVKK